ncbi:hypothetical protein [Bowmanella sp. JS7-9]|uniref:Tripartite ATP-independent transporter, DctQ component n=1 Tax=Pseudobowmanella zhangzhouensis TaxID=1537679 RepID=A0ABW1XFL3_9ALTE|nr:hypothetical protein [Bowmanella sp. JS7-9]TBX21206.1 hypothetical protein TK45_11515 [Bowmanella sp. JS7-9]
MRSTHYLAIMVRLFSVALFLKAFERFALYLGVIWNEDTLGSPLFNFVDVLTIIILTIVAILLWSFPLSTAKSILTPELEQPVKPLLPITFLSVAIVGIALLTLYFAIADAVYWVTIWNLSKQEVMKLEPFYFESQDIAAIWATTVQFGMSVILLLRPKTIASTLLRIAR